MSNFSQSGQHTPRPKLSMPQQRRPYKPKAWSHQDDLKDAVGKHIEIQLNSGPLLAGRLVAADAYTIKLKRASSSLVTINKSALTYYEITDAV